MKDKYYIVEIDGFIVSVIDIKGKANKYGTVKYFETKKDAEKWIVKHSYKGMSFQYEVRSREG